MGANHSTNTREDFWKDFPGEPSEFLEAVRNGIHYEISLSHFIEQGVKDLRTEHEGVSTKFLKSIYGEWRFNAAYCETKYGLRISSALAEYHQAVMERQAANVLAVKEYEERLALGPPVPPNGFYWNEDSSCVRLPQVHRYNLWNNCLGYPKGGG